jgi:hypothetical protein
MDEEQQKRVYNELLDKNKEAYAAARKKKDNRRQELEETFMDCGCGSNCNCDDCLCPACVKKKNEQRKALNEELNAPA